METGEEKEVEYCLYARKSSESDERQAMSIDSQIKEMGELAEKNSLNVKEIRRESHSAKVSGQRPVFNGILEDLTNKTFNGILTWSPDRLSRNAGDLGRLVDLMDGGALRQIRTFSQSFGNNPNEKFLLMILCSQAKLENDNRALSIKRGIRAKCEMGWRPGVAPLGYYNRSFGGVKDIVVDPERAPIIKEMFKRVAKYEQSGRTIKRWLDKIGFTSRNGNEIALSYVYTMLKNPFYYGEFEYGGNWYEGAHEPLVSKELFEQVQDQLKAPRKTKWGSKKFAFKGLFTCAGCGGGVIGEEKFKELKDGTLNRHVYYHCSRSRDYDCKEPYINEKDLIKELIDLVESLGKEKLEPKEALRAKFLEYKKIANGVLDKEDANCYISFADFAKYVLTKGTLQEKRKLVKGLNLNLVLQNRKIKIK